MTDSGVNYGAEIHQKNGRSNSQSNVYKILILFLFLRKNIKHVFLFCEKLKKKPINFSNLLSNHQFTHFLAKRTKNIIPKVKRFRS